MTDVVQVWMVTGLAAVAAVAFAWTLIRASRTPTHGQRGGHCGSCGAAGHPVPDSTRARPRQVDRLS